MMKKFLIFTAFLCVSAPALALDQVQVTNAVKISSQTLSSVFSIRGSTVAPSLPDTTNCTASGETVLISSPGANTSLYINKVSIHNAGASNVTVSLKDGSEGTAYWKGELASEGGAAGLSFGVRGWKLSANTQLIGNLSAAGDVDINVLEYYIAP